MDSSAVVSWETFLAEKSGGMLDFFWAVKLEYDEVVMLVFEMVAVSVARKDGRTVDE